MTIPSHKTVHAEPPSKPTPANTVIMPGPAPVVAQEIKAVSPEKLPADPKAGPAAIRSGILILGVVVIAIALGIGLFLQQWALAGVMAALGLVGVIFNPVTMAARERAADREEVLQQHPHHGTR